MYVKLLGLCQSDRWEVETPVSLNLHFFYRECDLVHVLCLRAICISFSGNCLLAIFLFFSFAHFSLSLDFCFTLISGTFSYIKVISFCLCWAKNTAFSLQLYFPLCLSCFLLCRYFLLFKINLFIYLFLAVLGLRCCMRAFSSCDERGLLFVAVRGLLVAVVSLVVEHRL